MSALRHIRCPNAEDRFPLTSLVIDGATWEISSNGHALAARRAETSALPAPSEPRIAAYLDVLAVPSREPDARVALAQLVAVLGMPVPTRKSACKDCGGSGRAYNADGDCLCDNCRCECGGGTRWSRVEMRPVMIAGRALNANLAACALAAIDPSLADEVAIWGEGPGDWAGIVEVFSGAWRIAVLGCRFENEPPRFFEPGGAGANAPEGATL